MERNTTILSMATQKGGSGKTLLTHLISLALTGKNEGKNVLVIDADAQGSLLVGREYAKKNQSNPDQQFPYTLEASTLENLREKLKENYGKYDYIFIDIPGTLHMEGVRAAFLMCDYIFLPVLPSVIDFDAAMNTINVITQIKEEKQKVGSNLKYYCILNQAEPNRVNTKMLLQAWESNKIPNVSKPVLRYEKYKNLQIETINILDKEISTWGPEEHSLNAFFEEFKNLLNNN
jgi:chromosome partitioning protein